MPVSRLADMAGIGVDRLGALADREADPDVLRLENLDTDLRPPPGVVEATVAAAARDDANSYLPFLGTDRLRRAAAARVSRTSGVDYDWSETTVITTGGLSGVLNVLLAVLEPGDEVVLPDPVYVGLVNRVRLAGGVPRFVRCEVVGGVWRLDPRPPRRGRHRAHAGVPVHEPRHADRRRPDARTTGSPSAPRAAAPTLG